MLCSEIGKEPKKALQNYGIYKSIGNNRFFDTVDEAIEYATAIEDAKIEAKKHKKHEKE